MRGSISAILFALASSASAFTVWDNYGYWDGNVTNGWLAQNQKFTPPAPDNTLVHWQFAMDAAAGGLTMEFRIEEVSGGIPNGTIVYSAPFVSPTGGGDVIFTGLNVSLDPSKTYAAIVDFKGYSGYSIHFTGTDVVPGNGMWWSGASWSDYPTLDQKLHAEFVPEPATLLAFSCGLALLARRLRKS
ncbi:MAG TPA: PEP-CTERM sorting domain-containing protein [Fimbriimonadales bacterium]|nr:PEP-CTERM sorting domain-containing protein [Fimbriimonadales bacterium]